MRGAMAGTWELSAAVGAAGRFGAVAEKARGPTRLRRNPAGPVLSV